jgi:hypothetical protein
MDIKQLFSSLTSLIPFWSSSIIKFIGVGPEYAVTLNLVFSSLVSHVENHISEEVAIFTIIITIILAICYKNNILSYIPNIFPNKKCLEFVIYSDDNSSSSFKIINALTNKILNTPEYNFEQCVFGENFGSTCLLCDTFDFKLENSLFLTVVRYDAIRNISAIKYVISSNRIDLNKFIDDAVEKYSSSGNVIFLHGEESMTEFKYSDIMKHVTCYLQDNFNLSSTICKTYSENISNSEQQLKKKKSESSDEDCKIFDNSQTQFNPFYCFDNSKLLLLDCCKNIKISEDIVLSVMRLKSCVTYKIILNDTTSKSFLLKAKNYYYEEVSKKYDESSMIFYDTLQKRYDVVSFLQDDKITALIWYLVEKKNYTNFTAETFETVRYTPDGRRVQKVFCKYLNMCHEYCCDELTLSVEKGTNNEIKACYTISSKSGNVSHILDEYVRQYKNSKYYPNSVYHFTLEEFNEYNMPVFSSEIMQNEHIKCHQTFEHLYTEHNEVLMNDITQLNDDEYYAKMGLKPKKSYIFYGVPGCGKSASVLAMAIYSGRHIVDINLSKVANSTQLNNLMAVSQICEIDVKKENLIMMFDEIDTMIEEINTTDATEGDDLKTQIVSAISESKTDKGNITEKKKTKQLNFGNILTKFDGICNYNKIIIVALTNHLEKLDKSLFRDMRLTKKYFGYCSVENCCKIITKFFDKKSCDDNIHEINDLFGKYKIIPAKVICFCDTYVNFTVPIMLEKMKQSIMEENEQV